MHATGQNGKTQQRVLDLDYLSWFLLEKLHFEVFYIVTASCILDRIE